MYILDAIKQLRDDIKNWVTNNLTVLNDKIKTKVDKVEGKSLSTNDFTDAYKNTLDNLPDTTAYATIEWTKEYVASVLDTLAPTITENESGGYTYDISFHKS